MTEPTAAEAIARAWHPIGCKFRGLPYDRCQYRSQHEHTGREALLQLSRAGYRLVRDPVEVESIPMFGEKP